MTTDTDTIAWEEVLDLMNKHATWPLGDGTEDPTPELTELLETSSVTIEVAGRKFEVSLQCKEVFNDG